MHLALVVFVFWVERLVGGDDLFAVTIGQRRETSGRVAMATEVRRDWVALALPVRWAG